MDIFSSVISESGLSLAFFGIYILLELWMPARHRQTARNLAFVLLGAAVMFLNFETDEQIVLDQRGAAIAIATIFGGIGIGAMTATVEMLIRYLHGGPIAWAGIAGIGFDWILAVLAVNIGARIHRSHQVRFSTLLMVGIGVGLGEALSFALTPDQLSKSAMIIQYGPPLFLVQLVSTLFFGGLLMLQNQRMEALFNAEEQALKLHQLLRKLVATLSSVSVHRDPTTAGHERRVTQLALAIGRKLGMDDWTLEGLELASQIHDIGQLQIPSEILTRGRRLMPEEMDLVRMHSGTGHEILKDIPFPWPVPKIVHQHHENLDGSGYPGGLKEAEIMMEAKIIRVADSMEAMLSHRPFRRAYDVDHALTELQKYSGIYYDPDLVRICIQLFREENFSFS